jgi:glycosyltransferase involved in cell wall biosynthesis
MPPAPRTALCLVVFNEFEGCKNDLPLIDQTEFDEVFAIDGGSTDGTAGILREYGVTVYPQRTRSLNAAYWQAVESSTCENVVVFFPKGTLDPAILFEIKKRLHDGHDLVIPSRIGKGARNEEDSKLFRPRKWGIRALAVFVVACWWREGPMLWDVLHGVKGFKKDAFLEMEPSRTGVSIDLEMVIRAYRLRLRTCAFPVQESARPWGNSRFKILPTGTKLAQCLIRELFRSKPVRVAKAKYAKNGAV